MKIVGILFEGMKHDPCILKLLTGWVASLFLWLKTPGRAVFKRFRLAGRGFGFFLLFSSILMPCFSSENGDGEDVSTDLISMSLEDLMNIEVTSVSKKAEKLSEAAAAIFVLTQDDIKRSGCTSIPEVLRLVPGLEIARIDASNWAITARGFNSRFANKLLVLIDGRSVYTPLFSGVYWDVQDTLLEDVDRIEVIRGPGAALWGANAVNGVINIITKSAKDTAGGFFTAGYGSEERGFGSARYGGKIEDNFHYRVFMKYFNRDGGVYASGENASDDWDMIRGGFRTDWDISEKDSMMFQGNFYRGHEDQRYQVPILVYPFLDVFDDETTLLGGNILGRWRRTFSGQSSMAFQIYYDRTDRRAALGGEERDVFDLDFQHEFSWGERHNLVWGAGYRTTSDRFKNSFALSLSPTSRRYDLFNVFFQDGITIIEDRLSLSLGSKFEHNDYTGFEFQPSMRLLWKPLEKQTIWAAVSRAIRMPSRVEEDVRINSMAFPGGDGLTYLLAMFGNRNFESEELIAYELGYRMQPRDRVSIDLCAFYNTYDKLRSIEPGDPFIETSPPPTHVVIPLTGDMKMKGETYGIELASDFFLRERWRLRSAYTYLQILLHKEEDSADIRSEVTEGESPHHQFYLWSSLDLRRNIEFDAIWRYVGDLPGLGVDSYTTMDLRLGWTPVEGLELSLAGRNLFENSHFEFMPTILQTIPTQVERSVYGKITWRF